MGHAIPVNIPVDESFKSKSKIYFKVLNQSIKIIGGIRFSQFKQFFKSFGNPLVKKKSQNREEAVCKTNGSVELSPQVFLMTTNRCCLRKKKVELEDNKTVGTSKN